MRRCDGATARPRELVPLATRSSTAWRPSSGRLEILSDYIGAARRRARESISLMRMLARLISRLILGAASFGGFALAAKQDRTVAVCKQWLHANAARVFCFSRARPEASQVCVSLEKQRCLWRWRCYSRRAQPDRNYSRGCVLATVGGHLHASSIRKRRHA